MRERDKVRESFTGKGSLGGKRRFMCGLKWFMGVDSEDAGFYLPMFLLP